MQMAAFPIQYITCVLPVFVFLTNAVLLHIHHFTSRQQSCSPDVCFSCGRAAHTARSSSYLENKMSLLFVQRYFKQTDKQGGKILLKRSTNTALYVLLPGERTGSSHR